MIIFRENKALPEPLYEINALRLGTSGEDLLQRHPAARQHSLPLDHAVLNAYGWPPDLSDEQILERLLTLNLERGSGQE